VLFVLAFDHRNSFRTEFLGLRGQETDADRERARAAKAIALDGLLAALPLPEGEPAMLVDDEYGREVAVRARDNGVAVGIPVERSGQVELAFEHEPFTDPLERLRPAWAKALVRYNPEGDRARNERQRQRLLDVQRWCDASGTGFMLELLVPPEEGQAPDGRAAYDRDTRPALTVAAVTEMSADGIAPGLWKLEGMEAGADYAAVAAEVRRSGRSDAGCVVLGRGADKASVDRWLALAAPVDGFVGFAVGRTLWWDALRGWLDGTHGREDAVALIAASYRRLVDHYLAARDRRAPDAGRRR